MIVIPTTFAGADIPTAAWFLNAEKSSTNQPTRIRGLTMSMAMIYDPNLFEMMLITDATVIHALRHLCDGFLHLDDGDAAAMEQTVIGMILVQFK